MTDSKKTRRSRGQHLKKNEAKIEILNYIFKSECPVLEPDLREHLNNTFGTRDIKTMKAHFWDLQKIQCIKKISDSGPENKWEINSLKQLNNIKENFKEIKLNCYKKAIEIVLVQFVNLKSVAIHDLTFSPFTRINELPGMSLEKTEDDLSILPVSIDENSFRKYLEMSPTFFDMCMSISVENLYDRWLSLAVLTSDMEYYVENRRESGIGLCTAFMDFYTKELPFVAFSYCVYMDILKGECQNLDAHSLIIRRNLDLTWPGLPI